jgi:hypothetical protein
MVLDDVGDPLKAPNLPPAADMDHRDVTRLVPVGLRLLRAADQGRVRRRYPRDRERRLHRPWRLQPGAQLPSARLGQS